MEDGEARDGAGRFVAGSVERRASIERAEFLDEFAGRAPLHLVGAAKDTKAVRAWDPEYVMEVAGDTPLDMLVGVFEQGSREEGYRNAHREATTLRAAIEALLTDDPSKGYLFNTSENVLRVNANQTEFQHIHGARANPGLARLDADFELPDLVHPRDLITVALVMGGRHHAAPLHYDFGGEGKVLVQVRGRKRVLLFHPENARFLYLPAWYDEPQPFRVPHASDADLHAPDLARFPELEHARCLEAIVEPGDVIYWPPFWIHDVTNLDPFTLAVTSAVEELGGSPMFFREVLGMFGRMVLNEVRDGSELGPGIQEVFRKLERHVQSDDVRELRTFFGWHATAFE